MTRYFFHLIGDGERLEDTSGIELPSVDAALLEAKASVRDIVADDLKSGEALELGWRVEVTDSMGLTLLTVTFNDVLTQAMCRRALP